MKNRNSTLKVLVCAVMIIGILSFVVSSFIPGVCADHDCAGEHCFICLCASIQKNLSRILIIAAGVIFFLAPAVLSARLALESRYDSIKEQTPVFLKVKLSN